MKKMNFKMFVLNEIVYLDKTSVIFIKKNTSGQPNNVLINDNLLNNKFDKNKYLQNIEVLSFSEFDINGFEPWKASFNFSDDNDFSGPKRPKFLPTDDKMLNLLKRLGELIK